MPEGLDIGASVVETQNYVLNVETVAKSIMAAMDNHDEFDALLDANWVGTARDRFKKNYAEMIDKVKVQVEALINELKNNMIEASNAVVSADDQALAAIDD